jgi:hypothetical protein
MNLKTFIDLKALGDERFLQLLPEAWEGSYAYK